MDSSDFWCWKSSKELRDHIFGNLTSLGVNPTKQRSQNFLVDANIIKYQVMKAELTEQDEVLEIGGGLASLTKCLASKAKKVYCIELDKAFSNFLQDYFSTYNNVEIINGDALKIEWPKFSKCISNLPYKISSPITFKLLDHPFDIAILMYQKEFADRLFAEPGSKEYSRLSVMIKMRGKVNYLKTVHENSFYPRPKVKSALVKIEPFTPNTNVDLKHFEVFISQLFTMKGKTVRGALKNSLKDLLVKISSKERKEFENLPFMERRIFSLSQDELLKLYKELTQTGWYGSGRK